MNIIYSQIRTFFKYTFILFFHVKKHDKPRPEKELFGVISLFHFFTCSSEPREFNHSRPSVCLKDTKVRKGFLLSFLCFFLSPTWFVYGEIGIDAATSLCNLLCLPNYSTNFPTLESFVSRETCVVFITSVSTTVMFNLEIILIWFYKGKSKDYACKGFIATYAIPVLVEFIFDLVTMLFLFNWRDL